MAKFKVGDVVLVVRMVKEAEGWENEWVPGMNDAIGHTGVIESINRLGVRLANRSYHFPEDSLALVKSPIRLTLDAAVAAYTLACEAFEAAELAVEKAKGDVADAKIALRDALDGES